MDWNEYFFRHVYLAAQKSRDPRTKIGAVLISEKNLVSTGFNGFPMGVKDLDERYQNRELKKISILNKSDIIHQKTRHLNHSTLAAWNRM